MKRQIAIVTFISGLFLCGLVWYYLPFMTTGKLFINLTPEYKLVDFSGVSVSPTEGTHGPIIPSHIVEIAWNHHVIIAKQKKQKYQEPYYPKTPDVFNYWILFSREKRLVGPLTEEEFRIHRNANESCRDLVLKDINELSDFYRTRFQVLLRLFGF